MTRILSLVFVAALAAGLFLLPTPSPLRLQALKAGDLLAETALVADAAGSEVEPEAGSQELWRWLLESSAASVDPDGETVVVRLAGTRLTSTVYPVDDPLLHGEARRSLLRGLRATLSGEGIPHRIEGAELPVEGGVQVEVRGVEGGLQLALDAPGQATALAELPWELPARSSLYPPLMAILLAILFRQPVLALFMGVFTGTFLVAARGGSAAPAAALEGLRSLFDTYFLEQLLRTDRQQIVLFVLFMLSMVGVMTRSGGIRGLMDIIAGLASSVRRTQIATWLMGLAIFFDDYANTILVGSTMRPLTDRFKIAREKLAYIVDSTAAPVAGLSIFSTWIAFEVSTFSAQLPDVGLTINDGYRVFLETLPMRFYCIFTLALVGLVVFTGRDFGPMLAAERRARGGELLREGAQPMVGKHATMLEPAAGVRPSAARALLPILTFIGVTLAWIAWKGGAFALGAAVFTLEGLADVLYNGDSFMALMVGSGCGLVAAGLMAAAAGIAREVPGAAWTTLRSMGIAIAILYLAWMIGAVCDSLGTAPFLTVLVGEHLNALLLPAILFVLAGVVAFSTGSSWSTMTILLPIVVALAYNLGEATDSIGGYLLMLISIGAVLEGSIFGDHCSPISDTTVMSSIASASDHIDHVRTQAPYAVLTMVTAMLFGYFPVTFLGLSPWLCMVAGVVFLAGFLFYAGQKAEAA